MSAIVDHAASTVMYAMALPSFFFCVENFVFMRFVFCTCPFLMKCM